LSGSRNIYTYRCVIDTKWASALILFIVGTRALRTVRRIGILRFVPVLFALWAITVRDTLLSTLAVQVGPGGPPWVKVIVGVGISSGMEVIDQGRG
jgi:hypothetical protein